MSGTALGYLQWAVICGEVELVVSACRSRAENVKNLREHDRWSRPADRAGGAYQIEVIRLSREAGRRRGRDVRGSIINRKLDNNFRAGIEGSLNSTTRTKYIEFSLSPLISDG
jgi:hypothetical protein